MFSKALLKLSGRLKLGLLYGRTACSVVATAVVAWSTRWAVVARDGTTLSFGGKELVADALVMCLQDVLWDSLHTKDFNVGPGSVGECIVDLSKVFLVDLIEMDRQTYMTALEYLFCTILAQGTSSRRSLTTSSIETAITPVALVVLGLLVGDENFQVVKVALAVIAPWTCKDLLNVRVASLLFTHDGDSVCLSESRCVRASGL